VEFKLFSIMNLTINSKRFYAQHSFGSWVTQRQVKHSKTTERYVFRAELKATTDRKAGVRRNGHTEPATAWIAQRTPFPMMQSCVTAACSQSTWEQQVVSLDWKCFNIENR